jgi:hypothetical protein
MGARLGSTEPDIGGLLVRTDQNGKLGNAAAAHANRDNSRHSEKQP